MKQRHNVSGKTIQVADKGLNCARNAYAAVKEANDLPYIKVNTW